MKLDWNDKNGNKNKPLRDRVVSYTYPSPLHIGIPRFIVLHFIALHRCCTYFTN